MTSHLLSLKLLMPTSNEVFLPCLYSNLIESDLFVIHVYSSCFCDTGLNTLYIYIQAYSRQFLISKGKKQRLTLYIRK